MINTAEEAKSVVTYSKFPPLGLRGQGSAFPAIGHGLTTPEYMKTANETLLTILQIESKEGVENVDAIAAVPGVGESLSTSPSYSIHPITIACPSTSADQNRLPLYRSQRSGSIPTRLHARTR
jgi:hypothetical protein